MTFLTRVAAPAGVFAAVVAVYWRTAYPTIAWWDSSGYSLAAATLGVASPPGSLLLTLLGWPVAKLFPGASTAHALNLLAGVLAALAVMLVYIIALRLNRVAARVGHDASSSRATVVGTALGALMFAFTATQWDYAVKFTPYILSAVFTGLIVLAMLRWWEGANRPDSWRRLALIGLLFGADFSVHRTNALLLPGLVAWILVREPRTVWQWRGLLAGACSLVAGLSIQLLIIPIAAFGDSPLNFSDPSNWGRFWDYITLKRLGGAFLLQLFPRKADLWSVQTADIMHVIGANFFGRNGTVGILGVLPGFAALIGLWALWRANRRLAIAFAIVGLLQVIATVLYFNIPANYFRSFDRHYLPICVMIGVLAAYGAGFAMERAADMMKRRTIAGMVPATVVALLVLAAVAGQPILNWKVRDASNRYFTRDWAANALRGLPDNAVYFTVGDNDTFPVMYLQAVEGVRRDVTIINLTVASEPEYAERIHRRDPSFPLSATVAAIDAARATDGTRAITYAPTIANSGVEWPSDRARLEGLYWRMVPASDTAADLDVVRRELLEKTLYRGFTDRTVVIDAATRSMAFEYYVAVAALLAAERARGRNDACRADLKSLFAAIPPERLATPPDFLNELTSACGI